MDSEPSQPNRKGLTSQSLQKHTDNKDKIRSDDEDHAGFRFHPTQLVGEHPNQQGHQLMCVQRPEMRNPKITARA